MYIQYINTTWAVLIVSWGCACSYHCQDIALVSLQLLHCCESLTPSCTHCHTRSFLPSFLSSSRVNTEGEASQRSWPRPCTALHYGNARATGSTTARTCSLWHPKALRPTLWNPWTVLHTGKHSQWILGLKVTTRNFKVLLERLVLPLMIVNDLY